MIEQRMAELAMQCWHGEYAEIIKLAEARGIRVERDGTTIKFKSTSDAFPPNQASIPTAIFKGMDPGSIFPCLGFAFFGLFWPHIMSTKELNKLWKEEIRKNKEKEN